MEILVINAGSSSLKYQLINVETGGVLAKGLAERIGMDGSNIVHSWTKNGNENKKEICLDLPDHTVAFNTISDLLVSEETGVIQQREDIKAIGHRVVHGGEHYTQTQIVTSEVKEAIKELIPLAPLHNPANLIGINAAEKAFPNATQVAVFDTAFHHTMPEKAFRYAIPEKYYREDRIRTYGFHGTSHKYVYEQASKHLDKTDLKAITIHLGNGASMCAINEKGESVETSMGFGPLAGLIMGTRSGDIDPSIIFHMAEEMNMSLEEIKNVLNKQSGMLGITGSNDARDVSKLYHEGDKHAILCYEMYTHRIKKYIGAYTAVLNGVDTIIFTAGIGENDALTRQLSCSNLSGLGIVINEAANISKNHPKQPVEIQAENSPVKILVIPTNEELEIALQTWEVVR
ncbi:acetate kinase [Niabella yanshanensis]|uniref:Acetate kinase n=1 Tax=Niabella yanshanensis TaxID=577386 RepID=A0ABZ0W7E4_9BACT|nr:acetate kinase [Niabella yanshanensis]WQD39213.1 acetate kinase [Niabella yanshanensis]